MLRGHLTFPCIPLPYFFFPFPGSLHSPLFQLLSLLPTCPPPTFICLLCIATTTQLGSTFLGEKLSMGGKKGNFFPSMASFSLGKVELSCIVVTRLGAVVWDVSLQWLLPGMSPPRKSSSIRGHDGGRGLDPFWGCFGLRVHPCSPSPWLGCTETRRLEGSAMLTLIWCLITKWAFFS